MIYNEIETSEPTNQRCHGSLVVHVLVLFHVAVFSAHSTMKETGRANAGRDEGGIDRSHEGRAGAGGIAPPFVTSRAAIGCLLIGWPVNQSVG